ncbi:MAG: cyclopropane-fatty-acyl-phospholipid synthase family protein, partial [Candidatus Competibacteraceae bacterium]|nr:cyclopropane-fatty-acyl-phospholipid synthase family protein [Candidatus Competibacteraceae bacterium]
MTHDPSSRTLSFPQQGAYQASARQRTLILLERLFGDYRGPVAFRLWDGTLWGDSAAPCTVVLNEPGPLREMLLGGDLLRLAEAHLAGRVDLEGDPEAVLSLVDYLKDHPLSWQDRLGLLGWALLLPTGRRSEDHQRLRAGEMARQNSRHSIAHHYDVSNDFYRLWLDQEMVYSCGYFASFQQSLDAAQRDKLDIICRKLRLAPGQRLLDIGCGWGALVRWAARHYGVTAHGITLSEQQYRLARERIQADGLEDQVTVELRDYRELPDTRYDRVVSVGMFEHIGIKAFPGYFGTIKRVLRPGGLFLNHGITSGEGWQPNSITARFINHYVFPDGELARISRVI